MKLRMAQIGGFLLALLLGAGIANAQFDELPPAPLRITESASYPEFSYSITQSSPDNGGWFHNPNQGFEAQHSAACAGPPNTHHVINYEDSVYVCNGHIMTAIDGGAAQATLV